MDHGASLVLPDYRIMRGLSLVGEFDAMRKGGKGKGTAATTETNLQCSIAQQNVLCLRFPS